MNIHPHRVTRETAIDALRGLAVIAMIIAHGIFFFHDGTNSLLLGIERIANISVLTLFVFTSGISASRLLDTYSHTPLKNQLLRITTYISTIYAAYIITAVYQIFTSAFFATPQESTRHIFEAATFISPPNFMEYIPLFIFFPIITFIFQKILRSSRTSLTYTLILSLGLYVCGLALYPLPSGYPFTTLKELFAGGQTLLRFPVLFYFPAYLTGLWWEHKMTDGGTRSIQRTHIWFMTITSVIAAVGIYVSQRFHIPLLSPDTRWPPSVGFLLSGLSVSTIFAFTFVSAPLNIFIKSIYRFMAYVGRDALDLWMTHLILLFSYHAFGGMQYKHIVEVFLFTGITIGASTLLSSIALTNSISIFRFGPVAFAPLTAKRFRKRYILLVTLLASLLFISLTRNSPATPYGTQLPRASSPVYDQPQSDTDIRITSSRQWHIRSGPYLTPLQITVKATDSDKNKPLSIDPKNITILIGNTSLSLTPKPGSDASLLYEIPASVFPAGTHTATALMTSGRTHIRSNTITFMVSEPLLVAWTFDWEGWDVPDNVFNAIDSFAKTSGNIPFTHFVNPRTFISDSIPENRRETIEQFLLKRAALGDEIALHVHMHYDLVSKAGVTPRKTGHWGFRSNDGYDVPPSEYTTDEFKKIVIYARSLMRDAGFSEIRGFRAGGWFLNGAQLATLSGLGFSYDTSGRDKPETGAFTATPWRLSAGAQPFYPSDDNQNIPSSIKSGILEIPNNGINTYEASIEQLQARTRIVYSGGVLTTPKTLVFVSHPQFSSLEFGKIPVIISTLLDQSALTDKGAVVFSSMNSIYTLWKSF